MSTLDPLHITEQVRSAYLRYLRSIYPFKDDGLSKAFSKAIEERELLVRSPILEVTPPFVQGKSVRALIADGMLHPRLLDLDVSGALPADRPLHWHQEHTFRKIISSRRNAVVATGTGSGKTESFLVPIIDWLLKEQEAGTLSRPGVRALLLYPMNALVNDQMRRLRSLLAYLPQLTFGRYTGETKERQGDALEEFHIQFPGDPVLPNELISRESMRDVPPHILITNYSMLEYLLLRPRDNSFFDQPEPTWQFLVLDEAHIYDGSLGIELSMLLRRLKDRIGNRPNNPLQCIATSATIGAGDVLAKVVDYASTLFGEPFEWREEDKGRQDVVVAKREKTVHDTLWGPPSAEIYSDLEGRRAKIGKPLKWEDIIEVFALRNEPLPESVLATSSEHDQPEARVLFSLLRGDKRVARLLELVGDGPLEVERVLGQLSGPLSCTAGQLVAMIALAARAKKDSASAPILPARYHVFAKALEGAFACLNALDHSSGEPRIFLQRQNHCPECESPVHEVSSCRLCGATYLVGSLRREPVSKQLSLDQVSTAFGEDDNARNYLLIGSALAEENEDEHIPGEQAPASTLTVYHYCIRCGMFDQDNQPSCTCADGGQWISLASMEVKSDAAPRRCVSCGSSSSVPVLFRFLTGQDAPVGVIATELYQHLPPDREVNSFPGEGRKLLVFTDSRQNAAFFAPYLERVYSRYLRRHLILEALLEDQEARQGYLRLQDAVGLVAARARSVGLFSQDQSFYEQTMRIQVWLMLELMTLERRQSLEGKGLLSISLVKPQGWSPPPALLRSPYDFTPEESWHLIATLLDSLRRRGAIEPMDGVDLRSDDFAPRNRRVFVRLAESDPSSGIIAWMPKTGTNSRLDYLERFLRARNPNLDGERLRLVAIDLLEGIWKHLVTPIWGEHLKPENVKPAGLAYVLSARMWSIQPFEEPGLEECQTCHNRWSTSVGSVCPGFRCNGKLMQANSGHQPDYFEALYRYMKSVPLSSNEHTAQWTSVEAARVQQDFIKGKTNVLSCSTTFELGVDVGDLQAVLMRNVPPTTANYVQRAGRAGRRSDSAALVVTYAQRRSHDLTYYSDPIRMVSGVVTPPRIELLNDKIIRRHIQATALASFLYLEQTEFNSVGEFFGTSSDTDSPVSRFRTYVESKPEDVAAALSRFVPVSAQEYERINSWGWLRTNESDGLLDLLDRVQSEVHGDLEQFVELQHEAAEAKNYKQAERYKQIAHALNSRNLIGFLASRNVLPKYGFPSDVVSLRTEHVGIAGADRVNMDRDLRVAIGEYAPGAHVVAGGKVWQGGGLATVPSKDWPQFNYAECPTCGRFHRSAGELPKDCEGCGEVMRVGGRSRVRTFVVPIFGFVASKRVGKPGEVPPSRQYASRVHFAEYAPPQEAPTPDFETVGSLSKGKRHYNHRYSRFGKLVVVNKGPQGAGFRLCRSCGFGQPIKSGTSRINKGAHENPRSGRDCRGMLERRDLGHELLTDVVEIQLDFSAKRDREVWLSVLYALLVGAANGLGIRRDDLDGTLRYLSQRENPSVVLFDNVPGGAGHVRRIFEQPDDVARAALEAVSKDCCGVDTSCYECLRSYRNQYHHLDLRREYAIDMLQQILT